MLGWYVFYVLFVLVPLFALIRLQMPEQYKEVKLTARGLSDAMNSLVAEQQRELREIIEHNKK